MPKKQKIITIQMQPRHKSVIYSQLVDTLTYYTDLGPEYSSPASDIAEIIDALECIYLLGYKSAARKYRQIMIKAVKESGDDDDDIRTAVAELKKLKFEELLQ